MIGSQNMTVYYLNKIDLKQTADEISQIEVRDLNSAVSFFLCFSNFQWPLQLLLLGITYGSFKSTPVSEQSVQYLDDTQPISADDLFSANIPMELEVSVPKVVDQAKEAMHPISSQELEINEALDPSLGLEPKWTGLMDSDATSDIANATLVDQESMLETDDTLQSDSNSTKSSDGESLDSVSFTQDNRVNDSAKHDYDQEVIPAGETEMDELPISFDAQSITDYKALLAEKDQQLNDVMSQLEVAR